ncbi:hypothetical protein PV350_23485 [Streptomyces sp. PA03-6a]|nr:hypothetical protein [Streptomyces sp. PA03-6a]
MKVTYSPEDGDEVVFDYNPNKLMSAEREAAEKRTGKTFTDFAQGVLAGDSTCRRVLLFILRKRTDPTLNYADVDFAWDELKVEMTKGEIQIAAEKLREKPGNEEIVENLLVQLVDAPDDPDGRGKAKLPFAV